MSKKASVWLLAFSLLASMLLVSTFSFEPSYTGQGTPIQQTNSRVRNLDTGKTYSAIQEAINAPETLDGHEIFVTSGTYYEHVNVSKSLSLIGENHESTVIDGDGTGKVIYVAAESVEVRNFTIQNGAFGLWLDNSSNSKIVGNTLRDGSYGLRLYNSRNLEVIGNTISGYTWFGAELKASGNSTLRNNSMVKNTYNFGIHGDSLVDYVNDIDGSNTVNGKPIHYLINQHNTTIDASTVHEIGYLGIVNSTNVEVANLNVQNNIEGILLAFTTHSRVTKVEATNNWDGIHVAHSSNILVSENNANSNFDYGIKFFNSSRSVARRNNVDNNGWAGIGLFGSPNSTIERNEVNFNTYNLHVVYTNNSIIARNNAVAIKPNGFSIAVFYAHNNLVYHNNFANDHIFREPRNETMFTPPNSWDNGLEGNYWSRFRGVDTDHDGIADTSYVVGAGNVDHYPLMGEFSDFTVTLDENNYSITIISNSTISNFQLSPDDRRISFTATGEKDTTGFSRIALPNTLLQTLQNGNLTFLINDEESALTRNWANESCTYFFFTYPNRVSTPAISPWLIIAGGSAIFIVSILAFIVLRKKKARRD